MWKDRLKEKLKAAIKKDGWGYDIIEADADGFFKALNEEVSQLLKEQREICASKVAWIDATHSYKVCDSVLNAPPPTGVKK